MSWALTLLEPCICHAGWTLAVAGVARSRPDVLCFGDGIK